MVRWKLKACPRCGSDMFIDRDLDNLYRQCLMCSYREDIQPIPVKKVPVTAGVYDYDTDEDLTEEELSDKSRR
jgi:DNA-directed RNA polymerase subunit M/transcription elongation factor TFIIS